MLHVNQLGVNVLKGLRHYNLHITQNLRKYQIRCHHHFSDYDALAEYQKAI